MDQSVRLASVLRQSGSNSYHFPDAANDGRGELTARHAAAVAADSSGCTCAGTCACAAPAERSSDPTTRRWAWWLTAATIGWNTLEAAIAIAGGVLAGSIALVGFGLDSVVEVSSALVIVWRLSRQGGDHQANERAERRAVRLIALSFFAIGLYVAVDSVTTLLGVRDEPRPSGVGLAITALSLVVMPSLAFAKRRVAARMSSVALRADAAETMLCTYLSAVVLLGLAANALFGWWWMDPIAGLVVAGLAVREGRAAWTSGELCAC
jgi:divalent metal cation (Fe/Co/Zn/Cd) transporter